MNTKPNSISVKWRKEGNHWYTQGSVEGLSPTLAKDRFLKASNAYDKAIKSAEENSEEKRYAFKNMGLCSWRISQAIDYKIEKNQKEHLFYIKESFKYLSLAYDAGAKTGLLSDPWLVGVGIHIENILSETIEHINDFEPDLKKRYGLAYEVFGSIKNKRFCAEKMFALAEKIFQRAVVCREECDFKGSLNWLHEITMPLEDADQYGKHLHESFKADVRIMKEDVQLELNITKSMQANHVAASILGRYTYDSESLDMNAVYEAMDWYKKASLLSRGNDLEQEAISCHHIGYIHQHYFKMNSKAKVYYKQVMILAEAAKPRIFSTQMWYKDSAEALRTYQNEAVRRDEAAEQARKQKYIDLLKQDLDSIKAANTNAYALIDFLYDKYPPRIPKERRKFKPEVDLAVLKEMTEKREARKKRGVSENEWETVKKTLKKLLLKTVVDYHPDKVIGDEGSDEEEIKKWKVFAGEITRMITSYYEYAKDLRCDLDQL